MSRSGYSEEVDHWDLIRWRGQVASAIRGKRGQSFLKELLAALDAMPEKRLVAHEFEADGQFCALGVIAHERGLDLQRFDPDDTECAGGLLGIANQLAKEIMFENDEFLGWDASVQRCIKTPESRWAHMRNWVASNIKPEGDAK